MCESLRKTFKYKLKTTAEQERELERVLMLCRRLYNTALEQRKTANERGGVSRSRYGQEATALGGLREQINAYAQTLPRPAKVSLNETWRPALWG